VVVGEEMESIEGLRMKVKHNDREMLILLKNRMELTGEIGKRKRSLGIPIKDPLVERAVTENAQLTGRELGLSHRMVEAIMRTVMAESRHRQKELFGAGKKSTRRRKPK